MIKIKGSVEFLELGLNNFCSLSCEGCPSLSLTHKGLKELDVVGLIHLLRPLHIERIVLCGNDGEPLEHSKIAEILFELPKAFPEAQIQVSTNGEKLSEIFTKEELSSLSKNILFEVAVDGSRQKIHELTRVGGSLKKVFASLALLVEANASVRVVSTRHAGNEADRFALAEAVCEKFGVEHAFRDTSIVNSRIRPPSVFSRNANVSVLYSEAEEGKLPYSPAERRLFINSNGDCYPCVSFVKYKTLHRPVNVGNYQRTSAFLEAFRRFQKSFCPTYQREGDIRQCQLNCGVFTNNYKYDDLEDLKKLYD